LPTEGLKKELQIIFIKDLTPTKFIGSELQPSATNEEEWPAISEANLAKLELVMRMTGL